MTSEKLKELIAEREKLFCDSKANDKQIDELARTILDFIWLNRRALSVEEIIEGLTKLGGAPSILYDDNGHFTIGGDGTQNLPTVGVDLDTTETTFAGTWWVEPGRWKKTIREALDVYLADRTTPPAKDE